MLSSKHRTDLAVEAHELWRESAVETTRLDGVEAGDTDEDGYRVTTVRVLNERGEEAIGKPVGVYITVALDRLLRRDDGAFPDAARVLGNQLRSVMRLHPGDAVLVVGLGNPAVTADAVGPAAAKSTMVTRHLVEKEPDLFGSLRRVSVLESGVLGTTGIESAELIQALCGKLRPAHVIVIDALCSRRLARICRTVQIADTGIVPGSGVGNSRAAINAGTMGVPVTAVGVPTVVDAATLAADLAEQAGADAHPEDFRRYGGDMIVTPKDIDSNVNDISKLIGYALNLALHQDISIDDITMFLS